MRSRRNPFDVSRVPLSRRRFLSGVGTGGLVLAGGSLLTACGTEGGQQSEETCTSEDRSEQEKVLNFSNWPLYIDVSEDEQSRPTLEAFEKETGIKVTYTEDVNDNTEFFGKVRNQLAACQETGRDMFVLTDWMAARMIRLGWLQKLDKANLENVDANLIDNLRKPPFDANRDYSVPWQSGLTGLAYNKDVTGEVRTVEELLTRPDLKGKVTLLSEMRDTVTIVMGSLGIDPEDFTKDEFQQAIDTIQKAVDSGQIRGFTGNEYAQDLVKGDIAACFAWSGDIIQLQFEDAPVEFVAPDSGVSLWSDNMLVPNKATHKANAEALMNYYYDPAVAAELAAWVNYICPVKGAREEITKIDPELAENPLIFPDDTMLSKAKSFKTLSEDEEKEYDDLFQTLIGA